MVRVFKILFCISFLLLLSSNKLYSQSKRLVKADKAFNLEEYTKAAWRYIEEMNFYKNKLV